MGSINPLEAPVPNHFINPGDHIMADHIMAGRIPQATSPTLIEAGLI